MLNKLEVEEWIKYGNMDFESASYLLNMKPLPYEIICYHCQQAVEKYIKAYIVSCDEELTKIHDLIELNKICKKYNVKFEAIDKMCSELNNYSVIIRYPFHTLDLEETDVKKALKYANEIKEFISENLNVE